MFLAEEAMVNREEAGKRPKRRVRTRLSYISPPNGGLVTPHIRTLLIERAKNQERRELNAYVISRAAG